MNRSTAVTFRRGEDGMIECGHIKPCPFCGGEAVMDDTGYTAASRRLPDGIDICDGSRYWIRCTVCGIQTARHYTPRGALECWHTRSYDAPDRVDNDVPCIRCGFTNIAVYVNHDVVLEWTRGHFKARCLTCGHTTSEVSALMAGVSNEAAGIEKALAVWAQENTPVPEEVEDEVA